LRRRDSIDGSPSRHPRPEGGSAQAVVSTLVPNALSELPLAPDCKSCRKAERNDCRADVDADVELDVELDEEPLADPPFKSAMSFWNAVLSVAKVLDGRLDEAPVLLISSLSPRSATKDVNAEMMSC
jgi:hypothetical protein